MAPSPTRVLFIVPQHLSAHLYHHHHHHHYVALDNIWEISIEGETKSIVRAKGTAKI
jgi:hypothetical protein